MPGTGGSRFFPQSKRAEGRAEKSRPRRGVVGAAKIVNDNVGLARDLARGLHPIELSASGLASALHELAFRSSQDGITCRFDYPKAVRMPDEAIALNLYRIAQEAVTNALKHGKPSEIVISLSREKKLLSSQSRTMARDWRRRGTQEGWGSTSWNIEPRPSAPPSPPNHGARAARSSAACCHRVSLTTRRRLRQRSLLFVLCRDRPESRSFGSKKLGGGAQNPSAQHDHLSTGKGWNWPTRASSHG